MTTHDIDKLTQCVKLLLLMEQSDNVRGFISLFEESTNVNELLKCTNNLGRNSLHLSAIKGDLEKVKVLIKQGIDPNTLDSQGLSALDYAALKCYPDIVDEILSSPKIIINSNNGIITPLHRAAFCNNIPSVDLLLRKFNINSTDDQGRTALHYATHYNNTEVAMFLILNGSQRDSVDKNGMTPSSEAEGCGNMAIVKALSIAVYKSPEIGGDHSWTLGD